MEKEVIAVFCRYQHDFNECKYLPKSKFRIVLRARDARGINFTGVILMPGWYLNNDLHDIYEYFQIRYPEFFNDEK